jgi:ADP-heptose:LPS heptosyltransferase
VRRVVIAPFSTEARRSLNRRDVERLLARLRRDCADPAITLAATPREALALRDLEVELFLFDKRARTARAFLALLQASDLFVGVDAGPLHLADALGLPSLGLFGPSAPQKVLDANNRVQVLRDPRLAGVQCDLHACRDPLCIHGLLASPADFTAAIVDFDQPVRAEAERCCVA